MWRTCRACVLLAACVAAAATGQPLSAAPPEVPKSLRAKPGQMVRIVVKADAELGYATNFEEGDAFFEELGVKAKGERRFVFQAADDDAANKSDRVFVVTFWTGGERVGRAVTITVPAKRAAEPDVAPTPKEKDKEKEKDKPSADAPIPHPGLRVMIVFDQKRAMQITEEQRAVVYGQDVRDWLRANCVKGADGKTAEARIWPADTDASGESKLWQDAFARAKAKMGANAFWIIVSDGVAGTEEVLPATPAATLALLNRYKGK